MELVAKNSRADCTFRNPFLDGPTLADMDVTKITLASADPTGADASDLDFPGLNRVVANPTDTGMVAASITGITAKVLCGCCRSAGPMSTSVRPCQRVSFSQVLLSNSNRLI